MDNADRVQSAELAAAKKISDSMRERLFPGQCPDCRADKCPDVERDNPQTTMSGAIISQGLVALVCPVCGWRTGKHESVSKAIAEWNSAEVE